MRAHIARGPHRFMLALLVGCVSGVVTGQPSHAGPPSIPGNPGVPGLIEEINTLQTQLREANATIQQANATIEQANTTIEQLTVQSGQLTTQVEQLNAQVAELQAISNVAQTAQFRCWDEAGARIFCDGLGQDGEIRAGVRVPFTSFRFSDNGDGTVTDNLTRLIWLKAADCLQADRWVFALAIGINVRDGWCGLTDGSSPGDWRLPNVRELFSLIDFGVEGIFSEVLDFTHPFEGMFGSSVFWSSTTYAKDPEWVWTVALGANGDVQAFRKVSPPTFVRYILPVRGPQ